MVHQIATSRFRVFIEAFLAVCVVFLIGFSLGYFIESGRADALMRYSQGYEIEALDLRLQNYYYQLMGEDTCTLAIEQNFLFADQLYEKGLQLERYEESNQITAQMVNEKKLYVLLKTELWMNSILFKEKCKVGFDTIVYLYVNEPENSAKVAEQKIISNVLKSVKESRGNDVILLPIAGDIGLQSVELQKRIYNITSLPAIIINEKEVLYGFQREEDILKRLSE
ncbi:hypothetical protein J4461_01250 [Candidatus Pacearchaeota archaeon]|nr:hypothetical protein [Candidatus Pacearchaeota archaeon]